MNKEQIIELIEKIEKIKCPIITKGQKGCYIDCPWRINGCYGDSCLFAEFVEALESEQDFEI